MTAKSIARKIWLSLSAVRLIPHIFFMKYHPSREYIVLDIERWLILRYPMKRPETAWDTIWSFIQLMTYLREYRSLFYYRLGWTSKILYPLCRSMPTLFISRVDEGIGPGLVIHYGWATGIGGKKIGRNCHIFQNVTIGYLNVTDKPTIGDNVTIYAGAKVLGNVKVGDNSIVGANAVVVKDVPENCTVIGVPAYIVRRNGVKVKEPL
ncbi:MAG: serine O-acetyltransferase [Syntrophales bacterium]